MHYHAFISYSHAADGKLAPAVQKALFKFAKPWYKKRALDVFRDESSLSASPHLWDNIVKALAASDHLIYMASPESAKSKWVNQEISYWIENKELDKLIIVLTDGEILWDDKKKIFKSSETSAIPASLETAFDQEPFYLDLRAARTEADLSLDNPIFSKEILKLAAHLHGMAPKDMASEEVRIHRKTMMLRNSAIIGLSLLLASSIFLTVLAVQNSKEAKEQARIAIKNDSIAQVERKAAVMERDRTRKAKDEIVPWIIRSVWRSGQEYQPSEGDVVGIRNLIAHADGMINLDKLSYLSPYPIFNQGPHDSIFNWRSNEFAYYNPDFIKWVSDNLIPAASDESFKMITQKIYDVHLSEMAEAYCKCYRSLEVDTEFVEEQKKKYLDHISTGSMKNFFNSGREWSNFYNSMDIQKTGIYSYHAGVASGFWIRRKIDGTAELFYEGLKKLISTYDKQTYEDCMNFNIPFTQITQLVFDGSYYGIERNRKNYFFNFNKNGSLTVFRENDIQKHRWKYLNDSTIQINNKNVKFSLWSGGFRLDGENDQFEYNLGGNRLYEFQNKPEFQTFNEKVDQYNTTEIHSYEGKFKYIPQNNNWVKLNSNFEDGNFKELGRYYKGIWVVNERKLQFKLLSGDYFNYDIRPEFEEDFGGH